MLIVYSSRDEVFVCTPESEPHLLKEWFIPGDSVIYLRNVDDYDRIVLEGDKVVVAVESRCNVATEGN